MVERIVCQRRPRESKIGLCPFAPKDRLAKAYPPTRRHVLCKTINGLRIPVDGGTVRPLTQEKRDTLVHAIANKTLTFPVSNDSS